MLWNHENKPLHVWSLQPNKKAFPSKNVLLSCIPYTSSQKQPPAVCCKKHFIKNLGNFTQKNLCWRLLKACKFIKKDSNADAFYVKFSKILRTPIRKRVKAPQKNKSIACIRMVNDTIEQQILFIENMNLMKLVCAIFTLYQNAFFVSSFRPQKRAW